jgi:pimeloyl-ACP methyl ester carboxylesterase
MQAGLKNAYESIKAFSETDFTDDLRKIDVRTLVMHGEDDHSVPVKDPAVKSARLTCSPSSGVTRRGVRRAFYRSAPGASLKSDGTNV